MEKINPEIEESWKEVLAGEFSAPYFGKLKEFLVEEKKRYTIYPPGKQIFAAFNHTPFHKVKVVLLGQDPYHGPGQAHGLCFSVPDGIPKPPSLDNILKELHNDTGVSIPQSGNLEKWANQGVLLLNAILTVRAHQASSHQNKGWETFTDAVIKVLNDQKQHLVFMLWGNYALSKQILIDPFRHCVLKTVHPSPLSASRGFFGCRHFSKANQYLISTGQSPIDWSLS